MKKLSVRLVLIVAALLCFGLFGCKGMGEPPVGGQEEDKIVYAGTYQATQVTFDNGGSNVILKVGESSIFGVLTKDLAVVTIKDDGTMNFHCALFKIVTFDVDGTWAADETDESKIVATISGEKIAATCDGKTIEITYEGVKFLLAKDK